MSAQAGPNPVELARAQYADAVTKAAELRSKALHDAFARVPRERFLGPGPWRIGRFDGPPTYELTQDDDASRVYVDAVIAIDAARNLNNGAPSFLARCLDALDLEPGDRFAHIGCGTGYYTAIAAEAVGKTGMVEAVEVDADIASRAASNLCDYPSVRVRNLNGNDVVLGRADAILVNAGVTRIATRWLDALALHGRMLVPLTVEKSPMPPEVGLGRLLKLTRQADRIDARFISTVGIFHCEGARDDASASALRDALERNDADSVTTLRTDPHARCATCWFHTPTVCVSR